jgi:hypothetical protein
MSENVLISLQGLRLKLSPPDNSAPLELLFDRVSAQHLAAALLDSAGVKFDGDIDPALGRLVLAKRVLKPVRIGDMANSKRGVVRLRR